MAKTTTLKVGGSGPIATVKSSKGGIRPTLRSDVKLSRKHLKQSIKYNLSHAKDHLTAAKKSRKILAKTKFRPGLTKF